MGDNIRMNIREYVIDLRARWRSLSIDFTYGDDILPNPLFHQMYKGVVSPIVPLEGFRAPDRTFCIPIQGKDSGQGSPIPAYAEMHAHAQPDTQEFYTEEIADLLSRASVDDIYYLFRRNMDFSARENSTREVQKLLCCFPRLMLIRGQEQNELIGYILMSQESENSDWFAVSAYIDGQYRRNGFLDQTLLIVLNHMTELDLPENGIMHFQYDPTNIALTGFYRKLCGKGGDVQTVSQTSNGTSDKSITFVSAKIALEN
jgi:hypothetical protein